MPDFAAPSKLLTDADFERAALALGCEVAAIRAVSEVESKGCGFLKDGVTPKILFEGAWFHKLTAGQFDLSHPGLSLPRWLPGQYAIGPDEDARGMAEHKRLQRAVVLNRDAALQSASWGRFQIMGFNWRIAGCESLQAFINAMYRSEGAHLDCFISVIQHMRLDDELRNLRFDDFGFVYNGPAYRVNQYAEKMRAEYQKFKAAA